MGKKKEPSINDSLNLFKDVMKRSSILDYLYVNRNAFCINSKGMRIYLHIDQSLWNIIMEDDDLKTHFKELDITKEEQRIVANRLSYFEDLEEGWIEMDAEKLYQGEMFKIKIDGFSYDININKSIYPLRFKKAELNNFAYKLDMKNMILFIKKKFDGAVDDSSFTIMRGFNII